MTDINIAQRIRTSFVDDKVECIFAIDVKHCFRKLICSFETTGLLIKTECKNDCARWLEACFDKKLDRGPDIILAYSDTSSL